MRTLFIVYFALNLINAFSQTNGVHDTLELWMNPGQNDYLGEAAFKITCKNWNLKYKFVSDSLEDEGYSQLIDNHNRIVWNELLKKGIKESERKFCDQEVKEYDTIRSAFELLSLDSNYYKLYPLIRTKQRNLYYKIQKINDSIYVIEMYSYKEPHVDKLLFEKKYVINVISKKLNN